MEIEEIIKHFEVLLDCTKELNNYYLNTYDDWSKQIENGELAIKAVKELQTTTQPAPMTMEEGLIRDAMMFAVKEITGRVLREATVEGMVDDFVTMFDNQKEGE